VPAELAVRSIAWRCVALFYDWFPSLRKDSVTQRNAPQFRRHAAGIRGLAEQEPQLSQRDRATLRVIEYFGKSLKITQGHLK